MSFLMKQLVQQFGPFPANYAVYDIETTGPDAAVDLICSIGHVVVEDGQLVQRLEAKLDWTRGGHVDQNWLIQRMENTRHQMAQKGRTYQLFYDELREQGGPPVEILQGYHDLIQAQQQEGYAFVMHNGYNFDAPRLCNHFKRWCNLSLSFGPNDIWDTGMIEKGSQLNCVPDRRESMQAWAKRVGGIRAKGVTWALDGHCVPKYDLEARHGLDVSQAHGAGFDAFVTHLLFEHYRSVADAYAGSAAVAERDPVAEKRDDDTGGRHGFLG